MAELPEVRKDPRGYARVYLGGRYHALGRYGTREARERYDAVVAKWLDAGRPRLVNFDPQIREVCARYEREELDPRQIHPATKERHRRAVAMLDDVAGRLKPSEFGPRAFKRVRREMLDRGWSRRTINDATQTIRRVFRWASEEELCTPDIWHGLQAVRLLREGDTTAAEPSAVGSVGEDVVEATLPELAPVVADMVRVQLLTGMRPGEVCAMTPGQVVRTGDVWLYRPTSHKNKHRGKERVIPIGPKAQAILKPYLKRSADAPLFSPREAAEQAKRRVERTCDPNASKARDARRRRRGDQRAMRESYDTASYGRAIARAAERAKVGHWAPNQLRHARATAVRAEHGIEASSTILGHSNLSTTEIYAERNLTLAMRIAAESG